MKIVKRNGQFYMQDELTARELCIKAPAKVNLSLHIKGRRPDGYHELSGIVAFADIADELLFKHEDHPEVTGSSEGWSLEITGPFCEHFHKASQNLQDNLIIKASRLFQKEFEGCPGGEILLEKNLPIAAGIGGGSSDAAATLKALQEFCSYAPDDDELDDLAVELGADVPMCLTPKAKIISGAGDIYEMLLGFQPLPAVLVNPRVGVSTAHVFKELAAPELAPLDDQEALKKFLSEAMKEQDAYDIFKVIKDPTPLTVINWLRGQRNDLQESAIRLAPVIADVLAILDKDNNCQLARMSGSGATCFGLYENMNDANEAAQKISTDHPDWWVEATMLR